MTRSFAVHLFCVLAALGTASQAHALGAESRAATSGELRRASARLSRALGTRVLLRRGRIAALVSPAEVLVTTVPRELQRQVECSPLIVDALPQCEASRDPLFFVVPMDGAPPRAFRVRTQGYVRLGLNRFDVHAADMDADGFPDLVVTSELYVPEITDDLVLRGDVMLVLAMRDTPRLLGEERVSLCHNIEGLRVCDVRTMLFADQDGDGLTEIRIAYDGQVADFYQGELSYPREISFEYDRARGTVVRAISAPAASP